MNQLSEFNAFVAVVDKGSFSAASDHLNIAKSAISKKVSQLEKRLGVLLLQRTTRRLSLTEAGRIFYDQAVQILGDIKEAEASVSRESPELNGVLKIAAPLSFGLRHLSSAISEFMHLHSELIIDLDLNDRQINLIEDGFDMVVRIGKLPDSNLIARRIAPIKLQLCASPDYLEKWGEPLVPNDLLNHRCLSYANIGKQWRFYDQVGKSYVVNVPVALRANNGDVLRDAAISGLGIVMSPTFISYQALEQKKLIPIMSDYSSELSFAYAIYPQTRFLSNKVRAFIDFLADNFGDQPYWDEF